MERAGGTSATGRQPWRQRETPSLIWNGTTTRNSFSYMERKTLIAHTRGLIEVGGGVALLYQHYPHSGVAHVIFNREQLCKIGKSQYRCLHHSLLEKIES